MMDTQTDASLFFRFQEYHGILSLIEWALPSFAAVLFVWLVSISLNCCLCFCCRNNNKVSNLDASDDIRLSKGTDSVARRFRYYLLIINDKWTEGAMIIVFFFTYTDVFFYGFASSTILSSSLSALYLLSIIFLIYYIGYWVRLMVGVLLIAFYYKK